MGISATGIPPSGSPHFVNRTTAPAGLSRDQSEPNPDATRDSSGDSASNVKSTPSVRGLTRHIVPPNLGTATQTHFRRRVPKAMRGGAPPGGRRRAPVRAPEWASIRYRVELVPFDATTQTAPVPTPSPVLEKDVGRDVVAVVSPVRGSMRSTTSRGPRPRTHTAPAPTTTATGSWWSAYSILPGASATVRACREAIRVRRYSPRAPTPTTHAPAASAANTGPSRHVRWFGVAERTVVRSTVLVRASTSETEPLAWLYTQRLCPWAATAWGLA